MSILGSFLNAATKRLDRFSEKILELGCSFVEASRNFFIKFLHKKAAKSLSNLCRKY
jgi:hypothetical protein